MARKLRVEYSGPIYPVRNLGDRLQPIFATDRHRTLFLDTLAETRQKTGGQGDAQKRKMGRRLRQETMMIRRSIAKRLHMGGPFPWRTCCAGAKKARICDYVGLTHSRRTDFVRLGKSRRKSGF
jgi:hypothetical protein